ncbi:MAG: acyltransferase [Gemmatimonadaceae bacterium]
MPARLRTVDGLRAFALALVLFNHASNTTGFPSWLAPLTHDPHLGFAGHGVKLFFVISGFLVTSVLLREVERTGAIDGRAFLLRRARRIFPPYFAFVLILGVLRLAGFFEFNARHFLAALTFTGGAGGELGHLWSMAVQEQFYLAWPLILIVGGRSIAVYCAIAIVILVPIARVALATLAPETTSVYLTWGASIDTLALGCLLALDRERLAGIRWFNRIVESPCSIPLLYVVAGASLMIGWRPSILLRTPLVSLALVLLLERCLRHSDRGVFRLLNTRWVVYLGSASFSIYLWQQPFLNLFSSPSSASFPANILAGIAAGLISWRLLEQPLAAHRARARVVAIADAGSHPSSVLTMPTPRATSDVRLAGAMA